MSHFSTKVPKKDNRERKTCVSSFPIVFCFFETLIFGCKFGCKPCKLLNINIFCGAGGNRTRVQTRKPYAFYMLIPAFIFVMQQDLDHQLHPYPLKFHHTVKARHDNSRFSCAA